MVILIGGTGNSGKTKLANTLMNSFGIPYFSLDHLMMGIFRSDDNCGFTPMSTVSVINKHLWPITREMIKTNIENNHSIIFEGFQILPENLDEFQEEYQSEILPIFLCLSPEYIENRYDQIAKYRSVVEARCDVDDMPTMKRLNANLIDSCIASSKRYYAIKNDYANEISEIIKEIQLTMLRH